MNVSSLNLVSDQCPFLDLYLRNLVVILGKKGMLESIWTLVPEISISNISPASYGPCELGKFSVRCLWNENSACLSGCGCPGDNGYGVLTHRKYAANGRLLLILLTHLILMTHSHELLISEISKALLIAENNDDLWEFSSNILFPLFPRSECPWGTCTEFMSSLISSHLERVASLEEGKLFSVLRFEARGFIFFESFLFWKSKLPV